MAAEPVLAPPPPVAPVSAGEARPLWSVMIPTFNCAAYLRETLASVLAQDPGPTAMQIEVVDDCSTKDDPAAVVREFSPDGRVVFHRQPVNGGAIANFNTCIERSRGHLVHILHGDDSVLPGFYARMGELAAGHPQLAWFAGRAMIIDAAGAIETLSPRVPDLESPGNDASPLALQNEIKTPTVVIRRSFYERWGGFLPSLIHTADWEMWARARARGGGIMLNAALSNYRVFPGNDTSRLARSAMNLRDGLRLAANIEALIPQFDRTAFRRQVAQSALCQGRKFGQLGDAEALQANLGLWRELTPWSQRLTVHLRTFLSLIRRLLPR